MPRFLKLETQRRLAACQANLNLAFALLARPKTITYEQSSSDGAVEVGLIGVAADLALSACLYEVLGSEGIVRKENGFYLTATEAVDKFRSMLGTTVPRLTSLTEGVSKPKEHLNQLKAGTGTFKVLASARAAAVHGGAGTSYEVAFYAGKTVSDFLIVLSQSTKWRYYLREIPLIPKLPKERALLAQELEAAALAGDGAALMGIFLVLPELNNTEPEWLASLEHVRVAPNAHDMSILIKSLQHANIGELHKVGKGSSAIPTIFADSSTAVPIYTGGYKKQFDNPVDSWQASIGLANSALEKGRLDLPTIGAVYNFASLGISNIGLTEEEVHGGLSAHSLWPFIAASLDYSGTKGPCFFLIRALKAGEHGQLLAFLRKARQKSVKIKSEFHNYEPLFLAVFEQKLASGKLVIAERVAKSMSKRAVAREKLESIIQVRAMSATLGDTKDLYDQILATLKMSDTLNPFIAAISSANSLPIAEKITVLRLFLNAASEKEDMAPLPSIIANDELKPTWTEARKAFQEIDFSLFGPQIEDSSLQMKL